MPVTFTPDLLQHCWFLTGPTASGKTAVSLELAERLNAEIVVLDSMTVYRGMDIGTAKATRDEQSRVAHHLLDIVEPHADFSLAEYLTLAEASCRDIVARGRVPLFVGGTGLYLRGVLRGVFEGPSADWSLRQELEARAKDAGVEALHRELAVCDPVSAARLHPNDIRRVIRAIEVHRLTGRPLSEQQDNLPRPLSERTPHVYWLSPQRDGLAARINARVEEMFAAGLLEEVRRLLLAPQPLSHTARQALGYKETIDWLAARIGGIRPPSDLMSNGVMESEVMPGDVAAGCRQYDLTQSELLTPPRDLIEVIQTRTRQFAKRQLTWFRNLEECVPIEIGLKDDVRMVADRLAERR